jgi:protein-S-isoprenylcysteine O-methyltransferase Ste14
LDIHYRRHMGLRLGAEDGALEHVSRCGVAEAGEPGGAGYWADMRTVAIVTLGKAFSVNVAIRSAQKVQRAGLYRIVRHPSYLGMELGFLAIGLWTRNWACLVWVFVLPTLAILYRIHVEEAALREAFGEEYADYSRVTKRLFPGVY